MSRPFWFVRFSLLLLATAVPAAFAGTPYTYELVEPYGGEYFEFVTMRIDALGRPHVAWSEFTGPARLRYAVKDAGVWTVETADAVDTRHRYASLALDPDGNPAIVYATQNSLKLARKASGLWSVVTIDPAIGASAYASLAFDGAGNAHVVYRKSNPWLRHATDAGGPWSFETVDSLQGSNVIRHVSMALDPDGEPWVGYADYFNGLLVAAHRQAGVWSRTTVDMDGVYGTATAVDGLGHPQVGYHSLGAPGVRFAADGGSGWQVENLDPVTPDPDPGCFECYPATAVASDGTPYVAYQKLLDDDSSVLMLARRPGSQWLIDLVDAEGWGVGIHSAVALDGAGGLHVAYTGSGTRAGIVHATPSGPTAVLPASGPATRLAMSCSPNPLRSGSGLSSSFALPDADRVAFALFDVNGRRVWSKVPEWRGAGSQTLGLEFGARSAGVYLLRLDSGSHGSVTRRIAIIE